LLDADRKNTLTLLPPLRSGLAASRHLPSGGRPPRSGSSRAEQPHQHLWTQP